MNIKEIKTTGAVQALQREIDNRIFQITNKTFENYMNGNVYTCLAKKLDQIEVLTGEIGVLLGEINSIDQKSK